MQSLSFRWRDWSEEIFPCLFSGRFERRRQGEDPDCMTDDKRLSACVFAHRKVLSLFPARSNASGEEEISRRKSARKGRRRQERKEKELTACAGPVIVPLLSFLR